jgi:hypothetical protein
MMLVLKPRNELSEVEREAADRVAIWISAVIVALGALVIGLLYLHVFRTAPSGPARDQLLMLLNAMCIAFASGFAGHQMIVSASRLRTRFAIPMTVVATAIALVGGNALLDASLKLKAEAVRAKIQVAGLSTVLDLARFSGTPEELVTLIETKSKEIREFQDPIKMNEWEASLGLR